ncbi:MAG: insulinase family protein [Verrucomicrobiaceae bacterium]|nr:insulinase family protein [Verrucomicrobiaceae bacterium]
MAAEGDVNMSGNGSPAAGVPEFPELPVEKTVFDNGLTLIVRKDISAPVASLQAWCRTGSIYEGEWMGAGLSHILEHMLFKGTQSLSSEEVAREVSALGGQMNAYTSFDRTVYYADCPSESWRGCLDVLMDVVARATVPEEEFTREQEVIRREFAMIDDDPDRVASREMFASAFKVHPYGIPVIGNLDIFNQLSRDDVVDYYRSRYVPGNLFFVIVGDVEPDEVKEQVALFFKDMPRKPLPAIHVPQEPRQLGRRDVFREFSTPVTRFLMAWRIPGVTHEDMPALDVLAAILGGGRSSRLHVQVRERYGLVHRVNACSFTPSDNGIFAIAADLDSDHREEVERVISEQVDELTVNGVSGDEVAKAGRMALASQLESLVTMHGQAADLGSNWILSQNLGFTSEYMRRISSVAPDDVKGVAERYLVDSALNTIEVGAQRESPVVHVNNLIVKNQVQCFELDNGLRLSVEEDRRLPLVSLCSAFRAGLLAESAENTGITSLLSASLFKGSASRSANELDNILESLGGSAGAGSGNNCFYVNAGVMAPDAQRAFDVVADVICEPAFPAEAIDREQQTQMAAIEEEIDRPMGAALIAARKAMFATHPYSRMRHGEPEVVAEIGTDLLKAFHARYAVGENGVVSVCGNIEASHAKDLAEEYFGRMRQGSQAFESFEAIQWPERVQLLTQRREKQQAVVVIALPGIDIRSPDRAAVNIVEEVFGGMDGRLFMRIREELGLAYYTGITELTGLAGGMLMFYAGTRPDAADRVEEELLSELRKFVADGVSDEELERAKRVYAGKHSIAKQSHGARSQASALNQLYELGVDYNDRLMAEVSGLKRGEVVAAAEKYLSSSSMVQVKVLP